VGTIGEALSIRYPHPQAPVYLKLKTAFESIRGVPSWKKLLRGYYKHVCK
jgi:hypothetical protein